MSYIMVNFDSDVEEEVSEELKERFSQVEEIIVSYLGNVEYYFNSSVSEIVVRNSGIIDHFCGSALLAVFGATEQSKSDPAPHCQRALKAILEKHKAFCRIVYGDGIGPVGVLGTEHFQYGLILPDFKERLEAAQDLEVGQILEIKL